MHEEKQKTSRTAIAVANCANGHKRVRNSQARKAVEQPRILFGRGQSLQLSVTDVFLTVENWYKEPVKNLAGLFRGEGRGMASLASFWLRHCRKGSTIRQMLSGCGLRSIYRLFHIIYNVRYFCQLQSNTRFEKLWMLQSIFNANLFCVSKSSLLFLVSRQGEYLKLCPWASEGFFPGVGQ